jgi:hypothetical protein
MHYILKDVMRACTPPHITGTEEVKPPLHSPRNYDLGRRRQLNRINYPVPIGVEYGENERSCWSFRVVERPWSKALSSSFGGRVTFFRLSARGKGARLTTDVLAWHNPGNYRPAFNALTMPLPKPLA